MKKKTYIVLGSVVTLLIGGIWVANASADKAPADTPKPTTALRTDTALAKPALLPPASTAPQVAPAKALATTAVPEQKTVIAEEQPPLMQNKCQVVRWQANSIYNVMGAIGMGTHLIFPENIQDVIIGNDELWDKDHKLNHVFIKPNSAKNEGETTTMTVVGESNTSYEFVLKRAPALQVRPCITVANSGVMMNNQSWESSRNKDKLVMQGMALQLEEKKKQVVSQHQNALDKYRGSIFTNYEWDGKSGGGWFGKGYVSDVYDDGRWTYVRVKDDSKAVMAIYGELDRKKDRLEFDYDANTRIYRVSGIYKKLILAYGESSKLIITRLSD
jgi:type IV secretory pathway VirB9-like protein